MDPKFTPMKNRNSIYIIAALTLLISFKSNGQQDPSYSMFMYNGTSINPAIAGSAGSLSGTALYRDQWIGVNGAPITQFLNVDLPVYHDKVGLGIVVYNDKIGVTRNQNIETQYAYRLKFEKGILAMGIQVGLNHFNADYASVITNSQNTIDNTFSDVTNSISLNVGTGLFYYTEKFSVGFSIPKLINKSRDGLNHSDNYRKYYMTASYTIDLSADWIFKPSTLLRIGEGMPFQIDINSNFWFRKKYGIGVSYRSNDSISGLFQLKVGHDFTVGYAYDYTISRLSQFVNGSNELMIRITIPTSNDVINQRTF